jgi:hypothetical protein
MTDPKGNPFSAEGRHPEKSIFLWVPSEYAAVEGFGDPHVPAQRRT